MTMNDRIVWGRPEEPDVIEEKILMTVAANPGIRHGLLREIVGGDVNAVDAVRKRMVAEGKLRIEGAPGRGRPKRHYLDGAAAVYQATKLQEESYV